MTQPTVREQVVRLSVDLPLALDVQFCDLCRAQAGAPHGEPLELRFRGQRLDDGEMVRLYLPLSEIEGPLLGAGALTERVDTDDLPRDKNPLREVKLDRSALTITKVRKGNGAFAYQVAVRQPATALEPRRYMAALSYALDKAVPELAKRGYAVGAEDVINIAGQLFDGPRHPHHQTEA